MLPLSFLGDPAGAIASIVNKLIEVHKLDQWARLIVTASSSYIVSFSSAMGAALLAGHIFAFALGTGLVTGAGAVIFVFSVSPLTRNMMLALPKTVNTVESNSEFQGIEHTK